MKIGICEKDLRGNLRDTLAWAAKAGLQGVQIWKNRIDDAKMSARDFLIMTMDMGLEVSAVGGGPNMVIPEQAQATLGLFKKLLDLSLELGCGIVTAETKHRPDELAVQDAWASTTQTVRAICDHAEAVGAVLAIEPAGPCFVRDTGMFLELKKRVDSTALKVNYDPANIVWAGKDAVAGVREAGADIVHTHAKDIVRSADNALDTADERLMDVPAGEGLVNYAAYLSALRQTGFDGYLTIEMHAGETDRRNDIIKAKENLEQLLEEG